MTHNEKLHKKEEKTYSEPRTNNGIFKSKRLMLWFPLSEHVMIIKKISFYFLLITTFKFNYTSSPTLNYYHIIRSHQGF